MQRRRISVVALLVVLCLPGRSQAQRVYTVKIDSVPPGAAVYLEAKEAGVQGYTPHTFKLKQGSYTFMLEAQGYQPFARTVKVAKASTFTFTMVQNPTPAVLMVKEAPGSSAAGAVVKVNGKEVGKVPVKVTLQPGRYMLEVVQPGRKPFSQWLDMQEAEKRTVVVNLANAAPGTGSLLVSSNINGAEVYIDGRKHGDNAPTLVENVSPGKHVVEVRAQGHVPARQEVTVEEGKTVKVNLDLVPDKAMVAANSGTLMVLSSEKNAEITVDGEARGKAPVKVEGLAEGTHLVEARKEGFEPAEQKVAVKKGEFQTIKLVLKAMAPARKSGAIRVVSPVRGAEVYIDGTLSGKTPVLRHQLDPGPHFVTVRKSGYQDLVQTVEVKAGKIAEVKAELKKSDSDAAPADDGKGKDNKGKDEKHRDKKGKDEQKEEHSTLGLSSHGAHLVPPSFFTGDLSLGFPHLFEGRLAAGLFSKGLIGMDGGVEFRTYGAVSEIGLHTKLRVLRRSIFALAVLFDFGGGGGPSSRSTIYSNLGVVASLWFKKLVTFSARAYFNFYTDRHCPEKAESGELSVCKNPTAAGIKDLTASEMRERFGGARFLLSAILEIPIHRRFNLLFVLEGAPGQGNRRAYTDPFAQIMPDEDPAIYGRVGGTFKY